MNEKMYINQVTKLVGFCKSDVAELANFRQVETTDLKKSISKLIKHASDLEGVITDYERESEWI